MKSSRARGCVGALALSVAACELVQPAPVFVHTPIEPALAREPTPPPVSAKPKPLPTLRRASGDVAVRLARFENAHAIEIDTGSGSPVHIQRVPNGVMCFDVIEDAAFVEAHDARTPLRIGERSYAGSLRVRARTGGGLEVTNVVDFEDYVAGVVVAEVAVWSAQPEELRAQAIAARSYAVAALDERGRKNDAPYLFDDVRDQAYAGALDGQHATVLAKVARAVASTRGLVLLEGDSVVDARFHASCGGATADARAVFPETVHECLRSVACEPCALGRDVAWRWTASRERLDTLCARWSLGGHVARLAPTNTDTHGRWLAVEIAGDERSKRLSFEELRRALGASDLQSSLVVRTWPRAGEPIPQGLLFEGRGRGHGVGLCQRGTRGYAQRGWSAERILAHYYGGAAIVDFR